MQAADGSSRKRRRCANFDANRAPRRKTGVMANGAGFGRISSLSLAMEVDD